MPSPLTLDYSLRFSPSRDILAPVMSLGGQPPANDDDQEQTEDIDLRATYAGAKRRIADLEAQLKAFQEAGTKRRS